MQLSPEAQRALGALIEKELTTPKGYPLSLNSLRTACNQTTNRDPVVEYDDVTVRDAVQELKDGDLAVTRYTGSNTPKYAHTLGEHMEIPTASVALLGVLLLRGPQTVGELRQRTERAHPFGELDEVEQELRALAAHPFGALVEQLPKQPGQKEVRWQHVLGDRPAEAHAPDAPPPRASLVHASPGHQSGTGTAPVASAPSVDVEELREQVEELRDDLETLRAEVERLRRSEAG